MSLRRKSCDPCFRARQKCNLAYPVCERCQKSVKKCHYLYPAQLPMRDDIVSVGTTIGSPAKGGAASPGWSLNPVEIKGKHDGYDTHYQFDRTSALQLDQIRRRSIPRIPGHMGELPPVSAYVAGMAWVFDQIRDYPLAFAEQAETTFIHKTMYQNSFPRPLRAAFGICAGCLSLNERNQSLLFQALDAEISELLIPGSTCSLLENLARLQAIVLYQIIRLFYGQLEQRVVAERQEFLVRSYALTLLQRVDTELQNAPRIWESWIFAESIRRTVFMSFKVYTIYAAFKYKSCAEITAMNMLPVSTIQGSWNSRDTYLQYLDRDETTTHRDFASVWAKAGWKEVEPFERFLLMDCKETNQC